MLVPGSVYILVQDARRLPSPYRNAHAGRGFSGVPRLSQGVGRPLQGDAHEGPLRGPRDRRVAQT